MQVAAALSAHALGGPGPNRRPHHVKAEQEGDESAQGSDNRAEYEQHLVEIF